MNHKTPYYLYDIGQLKRTLERVSELANEYGYNVHYALKANNNQRILETIKSYGLGADCVSGNEVKRAIEVGFNPKDIVFAGVGKTDEEIQYALNQGIYCFNCESLQELEVIHGIANQLNKVATVALRINPNVEAHTHRHITTGLEENKFGIGLAELKESLLLFEKYSQHIQLEGIHFHIGSQITDMAVFKNLASKIADINLWFFEKGHHLSIINVGGGLGIDYSSPNENPIPDFRSYFEMYSKHLKLRADQRVHFELGRSIVGQCGSLITSVLYTKKASTKDFIIVDAGMTELVRPALYQAHHKIENLSTDSDEEREYDVVGPVCETADCFGKKIRLPKSKRGDQMAIRSAGAYGEVMASQYNLRRLNPSRYVETNLVYH